VRQRLRPSWRFRFEEPAKGEETTPVQTSEVEVVETAEAVVPKPDVSGEDAIEKQEKKDKGAK
jgi:hypothetical protein